MRINNYLLMKARVGISVRFASGCGLSVWLEIAKWVAYRIEYTEFVAMNVCGTILAYLKSQVVAALAFFSMDGTRDGTDYKFQTII